MSAALKTKRPTGFSRRAVAILAAGVAWANSAASTIERAFVWAPEAYAAHVAAQEKLAAQREAEAQRRDFVPLSFREFVALVNPRYKFYRHCEALGDVLQKVADGEINRLMIFMPPRHGKSEETSRLFSAYFLYRYPERWVAITSYAADLAYTLSRASKDHFVNAGGQLKSDAKAVKHWQTEQGGGLWATGVGGPATGKGWHLGIIDDPLKNAEQAASEKIREKQREWFQSVYSTREEPEGGALVFILTRWHEDDLAGWQLAQEKAAAADEKERWHIINFEAIKEEDSPEFPDSCTVEPDWRKPGEALCPERYSVQKLKRIASQVGSYFWAALFQQRPRPKDGGRFKRTWFVDRLFDESDLPEDFAEKAKFVRYWDKARTEGGGDFSVGVLMARYDSPTGSRFYVLDVVRGQWSAGNRDGIIRQTAEADVAKWGGNVVIWVEQEPAKPGKEATAATISALAGFIVRADPVSKDKETRAEPFSVQCEARNVWLIRGDYLSVFLNELCAFPNASHDDQVDAGSGAFNKLALGRRWEWD